MLFLRGLLIMLLLLLCHLLVLLLPLLWVVYRHPVLLSVCEQHLE